MEISKIVDPHRRADLAKIIEELSFFVTLCSRMLVVDHELEAALNQSVGSRPDPLPPISLLGFGVGPAFGHAGGFRIYDRQGHDVTDQARSQMEPGKLDQILQGAELALERALFVGPQSRPEEAELRSRGWQPDAALKVAEERATFEAEYARFLDQNEPWRKGRLRDLVSARELTHELWDQFVEAVRVRGVDSIASMFVDRQAARSFTRSMPSVEVSIAMKTLYHRSRDTKWTPNTIFDIDAMALSVPYCDVVLTEKNAYDSLLRERFDERMHTVIMRRPGELRDWLDTRVLASEPVDQGFQEVQVDNLEHVLV